MRPIDLHTHSNRSDGSYTPTELVDYAVAKGLAAVALTDHDTIDGLSEALLHAKALTQAGEDSRALNFPRNMRKRTSTS